MLRAVIFQVDTGCFREELVSRALGDDEIDASRDEIERHIDVALERGHLWAADDGYLKIDWDNLPELEESDVEA
jgi:hypothetical protein